jgi:hypothetical protein
MGLLEIRLEALNAAITDAGGNLSPAQIVANAELFCLFLRGGEASSRYADIPHTDSKSHLLNDDPCLQS